MTETRRLGRGLPALLGPTTRAQAEAEGALKEIPVTAIQPNPYQPRREFDPAALQDLADSIAASGLLQPIIVRSTDDGRYELIAGERRLRAVKKLGWPKIPAIIKQLDGQALLTMALIENLQRDDISPIDEAHGFDRLSREFGLGQGEIARLVGKDRATVANTLRLLKLPVEIQALVQNETLSAGHARALLGLQDERQMAKLGSAAATGGWSVRELEARVRGEVPGKKGHARSVEASRTSDVRRVEDALRAKLQTDVRVSARRKGRGLVTIAYYSNDDLARLLETVLGEPYTG